MSRQLGTSFLVKVFFLLVVVALGAGGIAYFQKQERRKLEAQLAQQRRDLEKARRYIANLLGESRVAEFKVLEKTPNEDGSSNLKIRFVELAPGGAELKPRTFTLKGGEVYFDAVVIMFDSDQVMRGDARSLHLFRRVFTDKIKPEDGFVLWKEGADDIPEIYRAPDVPIDIQRRLWKNIVLILTDKTFREQKGVRTVFGLAASVKAQSGVTYRINLQNNGGLVLEEKKTAPAAESRPEPAVP